MKHSRGTQTRREALVRVGKGLVGGLVLPSVGCGLGPTLCGDDGPVDTLPTTMQDATARALLAHIDTFVVVMLENRSFDTLLGGLRTDRSYPSFQRIDGLTGHESNLDHDGRPVHVTRMPADGRGQVNPHHDWRSVRRTFNDGKNDQFVITNAGPFQHEIMGYLQRDQVPFFHALADNFTVCDRWFASFMGQTWPNRYFLHATTSAGRRENRPLGLSAPLSIWERMAERCYSGRNYAAGPVLWYAAAFPTRMFSGQAAFDPGHIEDFFRDARTGNLPNLAIVDPDFKVNDAYPTHSVALCEAFVASIVRAMAESPQWNRSLLIITFDEHGGYYDHVPPPLTTDPRADFRQLGFRVPAIVVGPTVWSGGVVSTPFEHVSLAATLRARFGIASLGSRMDAARDLSSCIDPARIAVPIAPPRRLPTVELDAHTVAYPGTSSSQSEMDMALASGDVPEGYVDARSDEQRFGSWLRHAQELEAVRIKS